MPRHVDKAAKKNEIIEAAMAVFAEKGLAKTKMIDIARAADIGKGTIYEYFSSKEDVFKACFYYFIDLFNNRAAKSLYKIYDPLEKLAIYIKLWFQLLHGEYRGFLEIVFDFWAEAVRSRDSAFASDFENMYRENLILLQNLLEECVLKKQIRPIDTRIVASFILGALDGLLIQEMYGVYELPPEKAAEEFFRMFVGSFRNP